ncbi:hypothetical protein [Streptomyces ziwulingensis]|uniref:Uncharacterized protein n=1 Tax=Streptomyces ziwulingensis TaxID=1045501 RepID=A0ABP9AN24_9ACTN
MEQRIGSSSQPLEGAGFDPAFVPGLTSPASGRPADAEPADAAPSTAPEDGDAPDAVRADGAVASAARKPQDPEEPGEPGEPGESGESGEEDPDGPVFEASDRRAKVVADHRGVRLALDDQECEFRWDEIGAVETETSRFGKRFTVTVHTPDRRWYYVEIEASARGRFAEWDAALDAVLDTYFDDEEKPEERAEDEGAGETRETEDAVTEDELEKDKNRSE